jgi:Protein of unknown function (DUF1553)/Protein of unknown function (DUF1549)/Planctomycete cytochrome C
MRSILIASLRLSCLVLILLAGLPGSQGPHAAGPPADGGRVLFRERVGPLLTAKCLPCHGGDKTRGGLDLRKRASVLGGGDSGPALVPGKSAQSLLYRKLSEKKMPPRNPLPDDTVALIKQWIDAGALYDGELTYVVRRAGTDWWSLQPVRRPTPPPVSDSLARDNPIDAFLLGKLHEKGLSYAPEADHRTLLRRVTFDLTGLPPMPEEVEAFVRDQRPDAYERLVDRLLASPAYGERWARHWLDVVRFAESHGYETNALRPTAWPYRDYVIRAFNDDIPYPQFIREQLAGDTVPGADPLVQAATGFLVGGAHDVVGNQTIEGKLQQRMDDLDDMVATTGATFLGLTVGCARCHDHKFDPITQRDYYGLQAVLAGVQHAEREVRVPVRLSPEELARARADLAQVEQELNSFEPLAQPDSKSPHRFPVNARFNVERFEPVAARFVRFTVRATNNGIEPCIDELEVYTAGERPRNVALASTGTKATASSVYPNSPIHRLEHINDGRHGNGRSWISRERGKGWVQLELPRVETIDRILWERDREERYRDRLPVDYLIEVAVEPGRWKVVASSADRQPYGSKPSPMPQVPPGLTPEQEKHYRSLLERRKHLLARLPELAPARKIYAGTFRQPEPTHLLVRGDPMRKGTIVSPSAVAAVGPKLDLKVDSPESARRLALARYLGSADNPLTARVMVNRVWHHHFGQGIVRTPSDFGYNGDRPSHPELLDWLASEYASKGWRLKPLHRLIVLATAYRQSGRPDPKALKVDSQNRLLWRMTPRRLEAEAVRDAILSVSGQINRRMGGPGYNLWEKNTNYVVVFRPREVLGPDEFRRMVYQFKPRSQQDPIFGVFDCPDAALAKPKRNTSTTVLQALNLMNSRLMIDQATAFADRLQREAGDDPARQVEQAFRLAFGRRASDTERKAALALVRKHGAAMLCRALFNANEFLYVD